jgi:glycosyltransferase involved in cell wall biosynthesis
VSADHLRICIDARLLPGQSGGIEQFVIGLASGLSMLSNGDEEYLFLVYSDDNDWLKPYLGGPCKSLPVSAQTHRRLRRLINCFPRTPTLFRMLLKFNVNLFLKLPFSDGTIESAQVDIMHFTFQSAFKTNVPSIYHPWDLQHLHLPIFFAEHERLIRVTKFRTYCDQAKMVSVASWWMKRELIKHLGLQQSKVKVVPIAPPIDAYPTPVEKDLLAARRKFRLPETFLFYPAKTWGHKNHIGLFEALHILRARHGLIPPLVCSGGVTPFFSKIRDRIKELDLTSQVRFIGFVQPLELLCLYRLSRSVIFPSKYEGWGLPVTESMRLGVPVACSALPVLKEQADDAALFFDPDDPQAIADAIGHLWTERDLRKSLSEKGIARASQFSWDRTARIFRAHYRNLAGKLLTEEDWHLLDDTPA